jgi:hypothetical protein
MLFFLRCGYLMIFSLRCVFFKIRFTQATTVVLTHWHFNSKSFSQDSGCMFRMDKHKVI